WLTSTTINVQTFLGVMMLVGIVVSNSILLVEFADRQMDEGRSAFEAAVASGRVRIRPILMTSIATVLGLMPMAFNLGAGGEANVPLARAVIGGLCVSTFLTLFLVPALYVTAKEFFPPKPRHGLDAELDAAHEGGPPHGAPAHAAIELRHGDSLVELASLEPGSIDVVVTSPPYNLGIDYASFDDGRSRD